MNVRHQTKAEITEADVRAFNELGDIIRAEERPDDPPIPAEEIWTQLEHIPDFFEFHGFTIEEQGRVAANGNLNILHMNENQHIAEVNIAVHPEHRRKGYGQAILRAATEQAQRNKRRLIIAQSSDRSPGGQPFLERYGFTAGLAQHINQAKIADLNLTQLRDWVASAETRAKDYELFTLHGAYPDDQLEVIAQLLQVMNGAPRGDLEMEDASFDANMLRQMETLMTAKGGTRATSFARHKATGQFVGLSELTWQLNRPEIVHQQGTGVHAAHQGHGLGRALKAMNGLAMLEANPSAKFIRTGNADVNAPMLKINTDMGFAPYYAVTAWQGATDTILERLS